MLTSRMVIKNHAQNRITLLVFYTPKAPRAYPDNWLAVTIVEIDNWKNETLQYRWFLLV